MFDEKCCSTSELRGRIFKAYQLTNGVQFNQWKKLILVAQGSTNRTCTIAVVHEIVTLIFLADINLFSSCMFQLSNIRILEQ